MSDGFPRFARVVAAGGGQIILQRPLPRLGATADVFPAEDAIVVATRDPPLEFCGPDGVFVFEDDCMPLSGAELIVTRVQSAVAALPGVEVVGCHRPYRYDQVAQYEAAGAALRVKHPPWGANATWYSPSGLQQALNRKAFSDEQLRSMMGVLQEKASRDFLKSSCKAIRSWNDDPRFSNFGWFWSL